MQATRREFLASTGLISAGLVLGGTVVPSLSKQARAQDAAKVFQTKLYKAMIGDAPTDENCERWKKAGFDGMEVTGWNISVERARENRRIAEKYDFKIHSVMRGWAEFNNKSERIAKRTIEETKTALRTANAYGAGAILLVPCRVDGMKIPEPWDFNIEFDPQTLKVSAVVEGDNSEFADYIAAQNYATESSIKAIESLIPTAAYEGVMIAVENVWNNLWCTPEYASAFVRYFNNPWIKAYLDMGNHTKYSDTEHWIRSLGNQLVKLHIKGFAVKEKKGKRGGGPGDWTTFDKATINWKGVRAALEEVNYNGWVSIEEGGHSDEKFNQLLDDFIADRL
ncbi:MAG: sugar phosphate isomerase/epimerase family protein [Thermoguttaceae bacterium]